MSTNFLHIFKSFKMEDATTDLFINLIQNNPIIFDKSLKDFKNIKKKEEVWASIAQQSRMTVEAAKKRYFSLRQKFCREKRNSEIKRRNKQVHCNNWIYYERLHFLDAFILPRATFTNDTGFAEEEIADEDGIGNFTDLGASQSIDIAMDESIDINELDRFLGDGHDKQISGPNCDASSSLVEEIQSKYTGDVSEIVYLSRETGNGAFLMNENGAATMETENELEETQEISNENNYMSPQPHTSSSNQNVPYRNSVEQQSVRPTPISTVEISKPPAGRPVVDNQLPKTNVGSKITLNQQVSSSPQQTASRPAPKNTSLHHNKAHVPSSSLIATPNNSSTPKTAATVTPPVPNDKSIEQIRHKMDSCLNAIANKMTEKPQRSPHAPFLAYLGTKLVNVPTELIANLEQEILDLVKQHSK